MNDDEIKREKAEVLELIESFTKTKKRSWSDKIFTWIFAGFDATKLGRAVLNDLTRADGLPDTGSPREVRMFWAVICALALPFFLVPWMACMGLISMFFFVLASGMFLFLPGIILKGMTPKGERKVKIEAELSPDKAPQAEMYLRELGATDIESR